MHTRVHTHAHSLTHTVPTVPCRLLLHLVASLSPLQLPGTAEKKSTLTEQGENRIYGNGKGLGEVKATFPTAEPGTEPRYFWLQKHIFTPSPVSVLQLGWWSVL